MSSARALEPSIRVIAPARSWDMSPAQVVDYARARNLPVPTAVESGYSTDANLWGRSIECGVLEDPWAEPPEDIYKLTRAPQDGPDEPAHRDRVRGRCSRQGQWHRDAASRADREPRHNRGIARRRANRHGREPSHRNQVARSTRRRPPSCSTRRTASWRSSSSRGTSSGSSTTSLAPTRTSSTTDSGSRRRAKR
jgi:hypothetical protein